MLVPEGTTRTYDDRGWTLFASILIDGKAASEYAKDGGRFNVIQISEKLQEHKMSKCDLFRRTKRQPPCTPARFEQKLNERKARAQKKGVSLFTNGSDQPFIVQKYKQAFDEQVKA